VLLGWDSFKWYRRTISRRCGETYQTSSIGDTRATPSGDVSGSCSKGDKVQNRSNGVVGKTYTHHQAVLKSVFHQKQAIVDSLEQAATLWDLGGQPAKDSGKEYSRLFKEIMGALTSVPRSANHSCRDRRICFRYKGSFTNPNTTIRCIASTNTHSITNTIRSLNE
jgi:hypothetical protein